MVRLVRWDGDGLNDQVSQATGIECKDKSLTRQSEKAESDINNILKRYEKTGLLPEMIKDNPVYGDFCDVPSYMDAVEIVSKAQEQFDNLDAQVRARFWNDPAKFLEFCTNDANREEMGRLGLLKPVEKKVEAAPPVEGVKPVEGKL